ncbi:sigma-70 family RNA polymerase sigma factor [Halosquirtibacter xylanolyticus]|uniref:sigma-70 family RNA polymerase sigma factor n=1 Tax=Halosquirtibacter xylanolyticus TaxID=3374599 RepID=UPI003749E780|nr:sigma-70 family RNA polymerase sigma factor [Prolixibacteraceae bacterium]
MTKLQFQKSLVGLEDRLYYYALSLTTNQDAASDLVQETFLKALNYQSKFKEDTNFKAWVYTIMKNTFINDYRKKIRNKMSLESSSNDYLLSIAKNKVFAAPDAQQEMKEIYRAIDNLPENIKTPFILFQKGYKYTEICDILGLPMGTVKSRIFLSRKKLEDQFLNNN